MKNHNIIDNTNPIYDKYIADWLFYVNHYKGGRRFLAKDYLKQYKSEPDAYFDERKKRAVYHNYVSAIVDTYVQYICRLDFNNKPSQPNSDAY